MKRLPMILLAIPVSALAVLFTSLTPPSASASVIDPGFDLLETGDGASVDLTSVGLGVVDLEGNPIGGGFGTADTIVLRKDPIDPFSVPSGSGTIDIELVAVSLVSVSPVDLTPWGGPFVGVSADLHITINKETEDISAAGGDDDGVCEGGEICTTVPGIAQPDVLAPSIGQMEVLHTVADGGTFDSCFGETTDPGTCAALGVAGGGVFADAIFTVVGGDPNNGTPPFPDGDVLTSQAADRNPLSGDDNPWSHTAPPGYPNVAAYPAGGFYPGVEPGTGGLSVLGIKHVGDHPEVKPSEVSVGGIAERLVDGSAAPVRGSDGSGSSASLYAAIAGAAAAAFAVVAGGWYARRRFAQRRVRF